VQLSSVIKNQRPDSKGNQRRGARAQPKLRVSGARRGGGSCTLPPVKRSMRAVPVHGPIASNILEEHNALIGTAPRILCAVSYILGGNIPGHQLWNMLRYSDACGSCTYQIEDKMIN